MNLQGISASHRGGTYIDVDTSNPVLRWYVACSSNSPSCNLNIAETGEWYHIVGTYRKNELTELYVNGEKADSDTPSGDFTNGSNQLSIGRYQGSTQYYTNGSVSDVRVYDHALTPSEIRELYELGGKASSPEDGASKYELDGDATDSWHSNDGAVSGVEFVDGKFGRAASFNGSSDYIEFSSFSGLSTAPYTLSAWIEMPADGTVIETNTGTGGQLAALGATGDTITFDHWNGSGRNTASAKVGSGWHHILGMWTGSQNLIYVDGKLEDIITETSGPSGSQDYVTLGVADLPDGGSNYFNSKMDRVRIYNRPLKDWEVKAIYQGYSDIATPPGKKDPDAVSRWKLDGSVGDSWGSNNGTDNTSTDYSNGVRGKAKLFDGSDDRVDIPEDTSITGVNEFTVSAWIKLNVLPTNSSNTSNSLIYLMGTGYDNYTGLRIQQDSNEFRFASDHDGTGTETISETTAEINTWYHVVATFSNGTTSLYVNGEKEQTDTNSSNQTADGPQYIGDVPDSFGEEPMDGLIDDVRVYKRELNQREVQQLYQWGTRGRDMRKLTVNKK
ncbi:MAG: hypothetical protein ACI8Z7_000673 [Candidatus Nanohaloarchaea archaeon]